MNEKSVICHFQIALMCVFYSIKIFEDAELRLSIII